MTAILSVVGSHPCPIGAYATKTPRYFAGARDDFVAALKREPCRRVLEIGCGNGDTGALALREGACQFYAGVELFAPAAADARAKLDEIVIGDVESVELPWAPGSFDALIMSEVLEHLVDPWAALRRLHPLLAAGARVFCSSPNVSHHRIIRMLWTGGWELEDAGVMDRTHLRWFTPRTYRALFEESGFVVEAVWPICQLTRKQRILSALMLGRREHVFWDQICVRARKGESLGKSET